MLLLSYWRLASKPHHHLLVKSAGLNSGAQNYADSMMAATTSHFVWNVSVCMCVTRGPNHTFNLVLPHFSLLHSVLLETVKRLHFSLHAYGLSVCWKAHNDNSNASVSEQYSLSCSPSWYYLIITFTKEVIFTPVSMCWLVDLLAELHIATKRIPTKLGS